MLQLTREKETYLADHQVLEDGPGMSAPEWIRLLRASAVRRFQELPFPNTHDEDWKYTDIRPLLQVPFHTDLSGSVSVSSVDLTPYRYADWTARAQSTAQHSALGTQHYSELVFVNGRYVPELSTTCNLPTGVLVGNLSAAQGAALELAENALAHDAVVDRNVFVALNTAFLHDAAYLFVPDRVALETPIHLVFVAASPDDQTASHPRVLIGIGRDAQATVIESYVSVGEGRSFSNGVTDVVLGEGAILDHYQLLLENERSFHIGTTQIEQKRNSNFRSYVIDLGNALARSELNVLFQAPGAECWLNGLYVVNGTRHVDNHTFVDHAEPHCISRENYKGVLADRGRGVFNGKVLVHKGADGTNAAQSNKNLLLSDDAHIDTKPQLEIFADDVKCSHGAAIGQLDENQVFYLKARGMGDEVARRVLTYGFAGDVINKIKLAPLREQLDHLIAELLRGDPDDLLTSEAVDTVSAAGAHE